VVIGRSKSARGPEFRWAWVMALVLVTLIGGASSVRGAYQNLDDLTSLDFEELMDVEITTFGMKPQAVFRTAAAVFVITPEDIRRSGATSIPELLRMVPGIEVSRINAHKWAITARGFNGSFATKLLVLMDGRSVYSPISSGVVWDEQDTLLEDVERIEVVRGPGGSLWGANAVNGVINIITKDSSKTQGALVTAGSGTEERGFVGARYGGAVSDNAHYRVYVKAFDRDEAVSPSGESGSDDWRKAQAGFRLDWQAATRDRITFQGDAYAGNAGEVLRVPQLTRPFNVREITDASTSGANFLTRWDRQLEEGASLSFQGYYDHVERDNGRIFYKLDTLDLDFHHNLKWGSNQEVTWGLNYRLIHDDLTQNFFFSFDPTTTVRNLVGGFMQDEISFLDRQLRLTLGTKLELNEATGFEYQPSARLLWAPNPTHSVWASVGRAVRVPDRIEEDSTHHPLVIPGNPPRVLTITGNADLLSEEVYAFELGYRFKRGDAFSLDVATFYNIYDKLRTFEPGHPVLERDPSPSHLSIPLVIDNRMKGETYGVELAADWRVQDWWRLKGAYTYLGMSLDPDRTSKDTFSALADGEVPHNQVSLRSTMDLPGHVEVDLWGRYVDPLPTLKVGSYFTLDVRLAWRPRQDVELAIVGQNLLDSHTLQWSLDRDNRFVTEVERGVYGKLTYGF
jgi:iron complex outermembrane recepter protein